MSQSHGQSPLYTSFSQHQLADERLGHLVLQDATHLAGLPDSLRADAAAAATRAGVLGRWLIANTRSSIEPVISYAHNRRLREQGWRLWTQRGDNGGAANNVVIADILQRAQRVRLLGHARHAHWVLDDNMAKTRQAAMALMLQVWRAAPPAGAQRCGRHAGAGQCSGRADAAAGGGWLGLAVAVAVALQPWPHPRSNPGTTAPTPKSG